MPEVIDDQHPVYIYALCEPDDTRKIRYIGRSVDPSGRYISHITPRPTEAHLPKSRWIAKLARRGLVPVMEMLEVANEATWATAEASWISFGFEQGWELLNVAPGGQAIT